MSLSTITIVVPTAENETVFLLHAVQAALKAFRDARHTSDHVNDNGLATVTVMNDTDLLPASGRNVS
jgi:hypothetical protein